MKPILVFITEKDGMVTMPKEALEKLIDEAYEQGKQDGSFADAKTITYPYPYKGTGVDIPLYKTEITC